MQVTDKALDKLEELRNTSDAGPGEGVTLVVTEDENLGLALMAPNDEDQVVEKDGDPVVIIPEPLIETLDGFVLDYVETPGQEGFTLERPNENEIVV
ncbi:MAG: adhesin [Chloroflexia bacterium]|jgi:Fe-S cluster assembly iron-binding protein IscA|nr:adhesin [Chloroflexia bacterium]